jgi:hypothetical protein
MGYGIQNFAVYDLLIRENLFDNIQSVVDMGSQELHFAERDTTSPSHEYKECIRQTIKSAGGPDIDDIQLNNLANRSSAGEFWKILGKEYKALDADGWYGKPFDFNLDQVEEKDKLANCFVINSGTTEHLIDQANAFRIAHDLTKKEGLMLHSVPFLGSIDHGFFNYNPNFFQALASFNSYEIMGLWLSFPSSPTLVPWNKNMIPVFNSFVNEEEGISLICLLKKNHDLDFCIPFQKGYEGAQAESNLARYNYVIDAKIISGVDALRKRSVDDLSGRQILKELKLRILKRFGV